MAWAVPLCPAPPLRQACRGAPGSPAAHCDPGLRAEGAEGGQARASELGTTSACFVLSEPRGRHPPFWKPSCVVRKRPGGLRPLLRSKPPGAPLAPRSPATAAGTGLPGPCILQLPPSCSGLQGSPGCWGHPNPGAIPGSPPGHQRDRRCAEGLNQAPRELSRTGGRKDPQPRAGPSRTPLIRDRERRRTVSSWRPALVLQGPRCCGLGSLRESGWGEGAREGPLRVCTGLEDSQRPPGTVPTGLDPTTAQARDGGACLQGDRVWAPLHGR